MLIVAARPPDEDHAYGHEKAEYFASGAEGALILLAAVGIAWTAVGRLLAPRRSSRSAGACWSPPAPRWSTSVVARVLLRGRPAPPLDRAGGRRPPPADRRLDLGRGAGGHRPGGGHRLDRPRPHHRAGGGGQIVWTGVRLLRRSALGLLDTALAPEEQARAARGAGPPRGAGAPVPRGAHAPGGLAPLRLHARAGARRLDGPARPRAGRADRGGGAGGHPQRHGLHAPRGDRGPGLVPGPGAGPEAGGRRTPGARRVAARPPGRSNARRVRSGAPPAGALVAPAARPLARGRSNPAIGSRLLGSRPRPVTPPARAAGHAAGAPARSGGPRPGAIPGRRSARRSPFRAMRQRAARFAAGARAPLQRRRRPRAGLRALAAAFAGDEVWVVAPDREQSASSHAISLHRPLRVHEVAPRWSRSTARRPTRSTSA